jgi:hypothetical protein
LNQPPDLQPLDEMTCLAFEAALKEPDQDASNVQLHKLIAAGTFSGHTLPTVAQDYLRAFCNTTLSHTRRRWIGIALAGMLGASPEVVKHFGAVEQQLQGLGDIILSATEREETRIVAGIIVQQALEHHVEFASFWTSDKVRNSALNFPQTSGPRWMSKYQSFLDTLGDLALANPVTDPSIVFPVSVVASDSFQWASPDEGMPIAIVQHDVLTILLPDPSLRDLQFLDVPVCRIQSTSTRPSAPLHDSQSRQTSHKPWDLTLTLRPASWTYLLNASKRTATDLTILFGQSEDARECEIAISELQHTSKGAIEGPSNSLLDTTSLPPQTSGDAAQQGHANEVTVSGASQGTQRRVFRSSPIAIKRRRQPAGSHLEMEQPLSDQLGKIPSTRPRLPHRSPEKVPVAEPPERSYPVPNHTQQLMKQQRTELAQKQDVVAEQVAGRVESVHNSETTESVQVTRPAETRQTHKRTRKSQDKTHGRSTRAKEMQAHAETTQTSSIPAGSSNSIASPTHSTTSAPTASNQMNGKGKLPKVSKLTKKSSSSLVPKQTDVFEIPEEDRGKSAAKKHVNPQVTPAAESDPCLKPKRSSAASRADPKLNHGKHTRGKRRAEEDDDFVPNATKKVTTKRKSVAEVTITNKQAKKKAKVEHNATAENSSSPARTSPSKAGAQQHVSDATFEPKDGMTSQRPKQKDPEKPHLPAAVSRTSLIGGLLGSQRPPPTPDASFKKPALPPRAHRPSTPTHRRVMPAVRPQTPGIPQKPPNTPVAYMPSSPPVNGMANEKVGLSSNVGETEMILSSNSKPVPASPHAESTAISGHADCDDVDLEKTQGEIQTARLDPFQQRRHGGQKTTSFVRRLTGDITVDNKPKLTKALSDPALHETDVSMSSDTDYPLAKAVGQFASQPRPDHERIYTHVHTRASISQPPARTSKNENAVPLTQTQLADLDLSHQPSSCSIFDASHPPKRKAVENIDYPEDAPRKRKALSVFHHNQIGRPSAMAQKVTLIHEEENDVQMDDSILTAAQESMDNTQAVPAAEAQRDLNGDTLVYDDLEKQLPTHKDSDLQFSSSPPVPGTPSSHSSTSAESESSSPKSPIPTSEAEADEWEANLQPHQRALHDLLIRVSKRVLRHVVDSETAVTDIAETFATDGAHLLKELLRQQDNEYRGLWKNLDTKKLALQEDMESSARALARERKRINALT